MKKLLITVTLLGVAAGIGYYLYQDSKKEEKIPEDPEVTDEPKAEPVASEDIAKEEDLLKQRDDSFPLKLGSLGKRVERLQVWLLRNLGMGGSVNGEFDSETEKRLYRALGIRELDKETFMAFDMGRQVHEQKILR